MDERSQQAILLWLGKTKESQEGRDLLSLLHSQPLVFFCEYLTILPPHLLVLFDGLLTVTQRGHSSVIQHRRRNWASKAAPEDLDLEHGKRRCPLLYRDIVGRVASTRHSAIESNVGADQESLNETTHPSRLMEKQRFASLLSHYDDEEFSATLHGREEEEEYIPSRWTGKHRRNTENTKQRDNKNHDTGKGEESNGEGQEHEEQESLQGSKRELPMAAKNSQVTKTGRKSLSESSTPSIHALEEEFVDTLHSYYIQGDVRCSCTQWYLTHTHILSTAITPF